MAMYEITVTQEFEGWFKSLEPDTAEHVATALEVLESAGPALDPVKASRYLLWYDGVGRGVGRSGWTERFLRLRATADFAHHLALWQKEVVRSLESPAFLARLARLDGASARRTLSAIESVKNRIRANKLQIQFLGNPKVPSPPSPSPDSVKRGLFEVLATAGVEPTEVADTSSGLREMTLTEPTPSARVIYGIDVPGKRILVILGEPLDRSFYGDSVRLAERKWREYYELTTAQPQRP
jgi:hypothetical protein